MNKTVLLAVMLLLLAPIASATQYNITSPTGGNCNLIGNWDNVSNTCTLTGNVAGWIQVKSDHVTLDGAGYAVDATGYSIALLTTNNDVTIKHLSAINGYTGAYSVSGDGNAMIDVTATANAYGIYFNGGSNCALINNTIVNNTANGLTLYNVNGCTVSGNVIENNGGDGLLVQVSRNVNMTDNLVNNNNNGVEITGTHYAKVSNTATNYNHNYGVEIRQSDNVELLNSLGPVDHNGAGVYLSVVDKLTMKDYSIQNSYAAGVDVRDVSDALIENVDADGTVSGSGMKVMNSARMQLKGVNARNNNGDGLYLYRVTDSEVRAGSSIFDSNARYGVYTRECSNLTAEVTARNNLDGVNDYNSQDLRYVDPTLEYNTRYGASFEGTKNIQVEKTTSGSVRYNDIGLRAYLTTDKVVRNFAGSDISFNRVGVELEETSRTTLQSNDLHHNTEAGVKLLAAKETVLIENRIYENPYGVWIDNSTTQKNTTFTDNVIENNTIANIHVEVTDDSDGDGVPDDVDKCDNTVLPEGVPAQYLRPEHLACMDTDLPFETNVGTIMSPLIGDSSYTLEDTFGCSCEQILFCKPGLNPGEQKFGCTSGTLSVWMSQTAWSPDCQVLGKVVLEGATKAVLEDTDNAGLMDIMDPDNDDDGVPDSEDSEPDARPGADGKPTGKPDWWCDNNPGKC